MEPRHRGNAPLGFGWRSARSRSRTTRAPAAVFASVRPDETAVEVRLIPEERVRRVDDYSPGGIISSGGVLDPSVALVRRLAGETLPPRETSHLELLNVEAVGLFVELRNYLTGVQKRDVRILVLDPTGEFCENQRGTSLDCFAVDLILLTASTSATSCVSGTWMCISRNALLGTGSTLSSRQYRNSRERSTL